MHACMLAHAATFAPLRSAHSKSDLGWDRGERQNGEGGRGEGESGGGGVEVSGQDRGDPACETLG